MYKKRQLLRGGFWFGAGFMLSAYTVMWLLDGINFCLSVLTDIIIRMPGL